MTTALGNPFQKPRELLRWSHPAMFSCLAGCLLGLAASVLPAVAEQALQDMKGRWSGWGAIHFGSGAKERVRCVSRINVGEGNYSARQTFRCASAGYRIDVTADLSIDKGIVTGQWSEATFGADGTIAGRFDAGTFRLHLTAPAFDADMTISVKPCRLILSLKPERLDVQSIAVRLEKPKGAECGT